VRSQYFGAQTSGRRTTGTVKTAGYLNQWATARVIASALRNHFHLQRAFDEYAERHGRARATAGLQDTTGVREVSAIPKVKIIVAMAELIGGYSFGSRPADKVARLHAELAAIPEKAFGDRVRT